VWTTNQVGRRRMTDIDEDGLEPLPLETIPLGDISAEAASRAHTPLRAIGSVVFGMMFVLAVGLVAPNPAQPFETPNDTLARAPERTLTGTAHAEIVVEEGGYDSALEGDADFGRHASRYDYTYGTYTSDAVVAVDEKLFLRQVTRPGDGMRLPRGAHWIDLTSQRANYLRPGRELEGGVPYLAFVNPDAERTGTEKLDGEPVSHYEFTLDVGAYLTTNRASGLQSVSPVDQAIEGIGRDRYLRAVPAEAWLDRQRRVRKLTIHVPANGFRHALEITTTFTRVGIPVDISAPDPSDVVTVEETIDALDLED
jgi:hypothetical protein